MRKRRFPRYLVSPYQVLWFESDDMGIAFAFLMLGLLFGSVLWIGLFVGPYFYMRLKKNHPRGFFKHCFYFTGFMRLKGYPSFFHKEFLE